MDTEEAEQPKTEQADNTPQATQTPPEPEKLKSKRLPILLLGLILLFFGSASYVFIQKLQTKEQEAPVVSQVSQPLTLSLISPANGDLAVDDEFLVSGNTLPNTTVVIFTEADETTVDSDDTGYFEGTVLLANGVNTLTVTAFSEDGQEESVSVGVTKEEGS